MLLGELLIGKGLITEAQLLSGLTRHYRTHDLLGECLILDGCITEVALLKAVSEQIGIEFVDSISQDVFTTRSLELVPSSLAKKLCVIVGEGESTFIVYFNGNQEVVFPLLVNCGMDVRYVLSKKSLIRQAIDSAY